jgi:RNA polymerase sigma-70 factor (ECF subfamily)
MPPLLESARVALGVAAHWSAPHVERPEGRGAQLTPVDAVWKSRASAAMDRYADGDESAFPELYDLLAPRIEAFFARRCSDQQAVQDLLQQTFLQIHSARRHFSVGANVVPWAFAIARSLLKDRYRRAHKEVLASVEGQAAVYTIPAPGKGPDEAAAQRRLLRDVEQELRGLPSPYRTALELTQLDGLSMAEAADALGTTVAAVKIRAHRAFRALRLRLDKAEGA